MNNRHPPVFIIAEAGVNHNGDIGIAKKLIDSAVTSGADAVKFQTFHAEDLVTPDCKTAAHQKRSGENNQFDLLKSQEFNFDQFNDLKNYCDKKKIEFISTPYDVKSVELLDKLNVKRFKIASAELVNKPVIKGHKIMARQKTTGPTDKELAILGILWENGPSTVRQVNEHMNEQQKTGYTTTLKLMQIMTEKGLLVRDDSQFQHIYKPADSEEKTQKQLVGELLEKVFSGSAEKLVMRALSAKKVSAKELAKIKKVLEKIEGK